MNDKNSRFWTYQIMLMQLNSTPKLSFFINHAASLSMESYLKSTKGTPQRSLNVTTCSI